MKEEIITLPFDVALPPVRRLQAGRLSCLYESGNLRTICLDDVEIVRMIYGAVRDAQWQTAPYTIQDEKIDVAGNHFSIAYTAFYTLHAIRYKASFKIEGTAANTITFHMQGEALSSFMRNRIGLCVLHPIKEYVGREAMVTRNDGTTYNAVFPKHISPHQPFLDICQLTFDRDGLQVALQFEGDVFETEDQRNWTDASFKTYSTPLQLPIPVLIKAGERLEQKVTLHVSGTAAGTIVTAKNHTIQKLPFPKIGFSRTTGYGVLKKFEIDFLKKIPLHHYRVELQLANNDWITELRHAAAEATAVGALLELILFFPADAAPETTQVLAALEQANTTLFTILICQKGQRITPKKQLQNWYPVLKQRFPDVQIGYGTDGNFAELNRNRPPDVPHDFLNVSLYPQVHAADTRSILENLETQHHIYTTIRTFSHKPVHISPVTFAERHTPDVRQTTAVAAWWFLKTLANVSSAGSITFGETHGARGLFQAESEAIKPFPLYRMWAQVHAFNPVWIIQHGAGPASSDPVIFENKAGDRLQFRLAAVTDV